MVDVTWAASGWPADQVVMGWPLGDETLGEAPRAGCAEWTVPSFGKGGELTLNSVGIAPSRFNDAMRCDAMRHWLDDRHDKAKAHCHNVLFRIDPDGHELSAVSGRSWSMTICQRPHFGALIILGSARPAMSTTGTGPVSWGDIRRVTTGRNIDRLSFQQPGAGRFDQESAPAANKGWTNANQLPTR